MTSWVMGPLRTHLHDFVQQSSAPTNVTLSKWALSEYCAIYGKSTGTESESINHVETHAPNDS